MWKYDGKIIREGSSWTDSNGIQHPPNWHIWSKSEKEDAGMTEVNPESPPDSRLYTWNYAADGVTIEKTAKNLADTTVDGVTSEGVKTALKREVQAQQYRLLAETDWVVIRKADKGTAIPSNIQTYRDAIRTKATEMENAIDDASDTDAVAALFVKHITDEDGNQTKTGVLYDWPKLDN
jgi:hypothetical protein